MSAADLENERLLEQATLAETFFEIRGQDQLQQVLNETVVADEELLQLAQTRYELGTDTEVSVQQSLQTLEAARATATSVGIARAQFEHAIATLLGKNATEFSMPVRPLVVDPPAIPTGTPSQLLERRPDIAAAERQMAAANATIGIGYAAYYPSLTLSASGGLSIWLHQQIVYCARQGLVHRSIIIGDDFRCRLASRHHRPVRRDLQR